MEWAISACWMTLVEVPCLILLLNCYHFRLGLLTLVLGWDLGVLVLLVFFQDWDLDALVLLRLLILIQSRNWMTLGLLDLRLLLVSLKCWRLLKNVLGFLDSWMLMLLILGILEISGELGLILG